MSEKLNGWKLVADKAFKGPELEELVKGARIAGAVPRDPLFAETDAYLAEHEKAGLDRVAPRPVPPGR